MLPSGYAQFLTKVFSIPLNLLYAYIWRRNIGPSSFISLTSGDDDQYSNGKLAKYKKMIEDSKKPFYHGCVTQYTRQFVMVKLFLFKMSYGWSDYSFKDLLTLLKDMLPQGYAVPKTVYEAK
jgi:hypothetical protein